MEGGQDLGKSASRFRGDWRSLPWPWLPGSSGAGETGSALSSGGTEVPETGRCQREGPGVTWQALSYDFMLMACCCKSVGGGPVAEMCLVIL